MALTMKVERVVADGSQSRLHVPGCRDGAVFWLCQTIALRQLLQHYPSCHPRRRASTPRPNKLRRPRITSKSSSVTSVRHDPRR
jgi:hypothetical protein